MADFTIDFSSTTEFIFEDTTDYSGLTGVTQVLNVYLPLITEGVFQIVTLASLVGPQTIDTSLEDPSFSMVDGVYRFELVVTSNENGAESTVICFVKDLDLVICRRRLLREVVTGVNGCQACEANYFSAALNSAKDEAAAGNHKEAELLVFKLIETCNDCP